MALANNTPSNSTQQFPVLGLGFRPFFLLAGIVSIIAMLLWMGFYAGMPTAFPKQLSGALWHGHEMVFGYSMAVITGFLLTAVRNWTRIPTISGKPLLGLALLWLIARIAPFLAFGNDGSMLWLMASADVLFMLGMLIAITIPIIRVKQWKQLSIAAKLVSLLAANVLFYLGLLGVLRAEAIYWGLYSGLYLVISLIMVLGRRVIPAFINSGLGGNIKLRNYAWLDISSLVLFIIFMVVEVFVQNTLWSSVLAGFLFALHTIRLIGWHTPGLWKKPLLWVLYVGYAFIVLGFGLKALGGWINLSPWLSLHAFAAGGIGTMTIGMMARVALGHTGRSVMQPPKILALAFGLVVVGAIVRVLLPIVLPGLYPTLVMVAQVCWIAGFSLFVLTYAPILLSARIDGKPG